MPEDIYPIINAMQDTMLAEAKASEVPMELDHLASLIRVVELFNADICEGTLFAARRMPPNMWCDSIFASVKSFLLIRDSARILSELELTVWPSMTGPELMNEFRVSYHKFHSADDFEHRLVLLLDLFKLQILWAAMNYR